MGGTVARCGHHLGRLACFGPADPALGAAMESVRVPLLNGFLAAVDRTAAAASLWPQQESVMATRQPCPRSTIGSTNCALPSRHTCGFRGEVAARIASGVSHLVAQVQRAGGFEGADQVELDVLGWEVIEQPPALPEQDRPQLDVDQIKHPCLQAFLRGAGTVQHYVAVAGCCFGLLHARLDAVGDVVDPLERVLLRWLVRWNEDRHAVVVVATPVAGEVPGPSPGDYGAARHRLVEH